MLIVAALCGCTGTLYHAKEIKDPNHPNARVKGVTYYKPTTVVETTETDTLVDKKGKVIGTLQGGHGLQQCTPILSETISSILDYQDPQHIWYQPGLLETHTEGFTLSADGALLGANVQSTPDQGKTLSNLAGALAKIPFKAFVAGPGTAAYHAACNAGKKVVHVRPLTIGEK